MPMYRVRQWGRGTIAIGTHDYGDGEVVELGRETAAKIRGAAGVHALELVASIEEAEEATRQEEEDTKERAEMERLRIHPEPQHLIDLAALDRETLKAVCVMMGSHAATKKGQLKFLEARPRQEVTRMVEALRADAAEAGAD